MPYNVALALQDGHSPEDIARYLGQQKGYNTDLALKDGHDPMDIINHLNTPEPQTSTAGAFGHGFVKGILPSAAGIVGGSLAAIPGAVAGPVGSFATGLAGGAAAAAGVSALQEKFLQSHPGLSKAMGLSPEQQALEEEQHPYASFIGEMAPNALALRPSGALFKSAKGLAEKEAAKLAAEKAAAIGTGAIGAGVGAGLEAGQQAMGEEPMDWKKVAIAGGMGALGQKETAIGRKLTDIGHSPFRTMQEKGGEYAKTAIKEAAEKGKPQGTEMAGYTPEEPGIYAVKVNGKEGTLEVMSDGTQKFNGQVVVEPIKVEEARPISTGQELPAALQETNPSTSKVGTGVNTLESMDAFVKKQEADKLKGTYEEPEEIMGTPDRPEATPIENTEPFPHFTDEEQQRIDQLKKEVDEKTKELIDLGKKSSEIKPSKKTAPLVNSLFRALNDADLREIDPRPFRPAKDKYDVQNINPFISLRSKKGNTGKPLVDIIADGSLNGYLPPELQAPTSGEQELMMEAGHPYDPSDADTYIKNKIGNYDFLTYETSNHIKELGHNIDYLEEEINRHLTLEEQNAEIQRLFDEQGRIENSFNEPPTEEPAGIAPASKGEAPEAFALESYTPEQIREQETAKEAKEAEETAKNKTQDEADRQAREQQEIKDRSAAASDDFRLGKSGEDNLSGQKDIFENVSRSREPQEQTPRSPSLKREISKILRLAEKTKEDSKVTVEKINEAIAQEKERNAYKEFPAKVRGPDYVREKLYEARRKGWLSKDAVDLALWFLNKNPSLANDLAISIRKPGEDTPSGFYDSVRSLMRVFKGSDTLTTLHEMMHHMERMMPEKVQDAIRGEWTKQFLKESNNPKNNENRKEYFKLLNKYHFDPEGSQKDWRKALDMVRDGKVNESDYQYSNSSEFWTVNASKIMQGKYEIQGRPLAQLRQWVKELIQHIKGVIGLRSDAPILNALNSLLKSDGQFVTKDQLSHKMVTFENVTKSKEPVLSKSGKEAIDIMDGLNRRPPEPDEPYIQKVKDAIQNARDNPSTTAAAIKKDAKSFVQHWSDKIQTWTFSADAALNNAIRRAIMDSTSLDMSEKIQAMMSVSMSQTVHADAVSSIFLEMGNVKYDSGLHKWVGEKSDDTFRALADKLNEVAKKNGLTVQQAEHMFHTATEARRLKDFIAENDGIDRKRTESKAQVQELLKQAADDLGKTVDLFGIIDIKDLNKSKSLREAIKLQDEISKMGSGKRLIHSLDPTVEGKPDLDAVKAQIAQAEQLFSKMPELEEAVKVWNGIRKNSIDKLVETGLWTKEEAQTMMDNINYVPFFREEQLENNAGPKEFLNGLQVQAKERRATGSYMPVNDIFDNMVRWTQYAINRSVRNKSSMSMVDLAGELGLAHKIPAPKRGLNVTRVWRDGKQEFWHMEDPMFVEAFHGLEGVSIPTFKAASAIANVLRKAIVLNPIFATSQVFQDSFAAIYTSGLSPRYALKIPAKAVLEYVRTLRGTSKTHEELRPTGAVGVKDYSSTATRNDAKIFAGVQPPPGGWTKVKGMLEHVSMASDNAVRQAVYQATMEARAAKFEVEARSIADPQKRQAFLEDKKAEAKSEALEKAFEVINFRRRGSAKMMMIGGQLIPFFNAYLAAQNVALKTLSGVGISPTARADAYKTLATTAGSVVTLSILYSMLNANDEDYLKKPATVRDRLLVIPGSGGFSIPLRSDVFTMPKIIAEHTYLMMTNNATEDARKFRDSVASSIVSSVSPPTLVPQVIKPAVEVAMNYDFFQQKPLIGTFQQGLDVSRQFNDGTSEFSRALGQTGLIAPINADHLIRGMTGSVGGLFLMLTNPLIHHDPSVERPTISWNDWMASVPGNSAFMSRDNQNGLKKDFYVLKEAVDKASATYNDIKKRSPAEAREYAAEPEKRARIGMHSEVDRIGKALTENRQRIAYISNLPDTKMSGDEKEQRIKALQQREDALLKNLDIKKRRAQAQL